MAINYAQEINALPASESRLSVCVCVLECCEFKNEKVNGTQWMSLAFFHTDAEDFETPLSSTILQRKLQRRNECERNEWRRIIHKNKHFHLISPRCSANA
jgi:hypothetical protein